MRHVLLLAVALFGVACSERNSPFYERSSGSVALSGDDAFLYVADADNDLLLVVDAETHQPVAEIPVGDGPEVVAVGADEWIYVANRFGGSVSMIGRGLWEEAKRIPVGLEPSALAVSPDGKTLYVVNAVARDDAATGTLQVIDTTTFETRWELAVGPEPRSIVLTEGDRALIGLFHAGDVIEVDLAARAVRTTGTELNALARDEAFDPMLGNLRTVEFHARALHTLVASPDGRKAYATVTWAQEGAIPAGPTRTNFLPDGGVELVDGDPGYGGEGCAPGVVSAGLATFALDKSGGGPVALFDGEECEGGPSVERHDDLPPSRLISPSGDHALAGPTAAVVDPTGTWLYVVHRDSREVAMLRTLRDVSLPPGSGSMVGIPLFGNVQRVADVGHGANGIAITADGKRAYVYSAFEHVLHRLRADGAGEVISERVATLAGDTLSTVAAEGRRLFHDSRDPRLANPRGGVSCASCHPDARDDGHVWLFPEGPRQTPSLAGRRITETAPYHWSGELEGLARLMSSTAQSRMGGSGIETHDVEALAAFLDATRPAANPHAGETATEAQVRGAAVFVKAGCDACHAGTLFTNETFADVGTRVVTGVVVDQLARIPNGFNTPSLLGLARTAPYLHDGSAPTLRAQLQRTIGTARHGDLRSVTAAELDDLVEYLRSL